MKSQRIRIRLILMIVVAISAYANKSPVELGGVACQTPPPMHCPDTNCPGTTTSQTGAAVEPKSGRNFFLDYPCDLKAGEKVTFVLSLHGAGSIGNWHRHYFPLIDFKDKYRLVIATPTSSVVPNSNPPSHVWNAEADDAYLQNIVNLVYAQAKEKNIKIKSFWLVGHSQGGATSSRLIRTDFFKDKVDGFLSLSGGRIGGSPGRGDFGRGPARGAGGAASAAGRAGGRGPATPPALPNNDFSFIYETGQHEMDAKGVPEASAWAEKEGCGARVRKADVVDSKAGYVYDGRPQTNPSDGWGRLPRPGTTDVYEYSHCRGGRIVMDVVRESKGHTEGLEPHITEELIKLMLSAKAQKRG
ncbi:MAG TPA: alpha/beta hydrolase [Bryobacteraceae bacterium]|nr:alpha/beta hydrolase [Bryobacteraceae bacterium]